MPAAVLSWTHLHPIIWALRQTKIASHFVELTPPRSSLAESALTATPTLIIGGPKTVTSAENESQPADIIGTEMRELEWIHQERNHDIFALDHNSGMRRIGFSVPAVIELFEGRHSVVTE